MKLIDTHTHLYLPAFRNDRDEMIGRSAGRGVVRLLMPNIDIHSVEPMLKAAEEYRGICLPMMGLHPTSVGDDYTDQLDRMEKILPQHAFIAVGEIGIDLYWDKSRFAEQVAAFRRQLDLAVKSGLPVVVHSRNSIDEVLSVMEEYTASGLRGVLHAFSAGLSYAEKAVSMGLFLGIGGPLTYKNSRLGDICREIGPRHIILETDSPYLAPVPYRGKRNESSYIPIINKKLAEVLGMSEEETASITFENSCRLFNLLPYD
ncbi:MAG TPA: TatD family hydrolase [Bacteroidales bacterium]|jgi:TatD DNase family protein|nr:TatD family hydrolase [Bacteroidales bacterium]HOS72208.1 TatD family hydrolase [Bacteroidales bacterium]HQH24082.1 TatD family hydrolase [Bacteroidales bacterium]HQJ83036.1 TatD family hydrolase [Bacteroidales bacterium]